MILGFNCYMQDAAACLLGPDGEVVAAVEEERLSREKHSGRFPEQAIRYCLSGGERVEHAAFNMRPWLALPGRARQAVTGLPGSLGMIHSRGGNLMRMFGAHRRLRRELGQPVTAHWVGHHHAHAASAFYPSAFERAAVLVADGSGELASTTLWSAGPDGLTLLESVDFPNSLGYFYSAMTQWLGFRPAVAEGKVMGLSSYGTPDPELLPAFEAMIDERGIIDPAWFDFPRGGARYYSDRWLDTFGPARTPESELHERHHQVAATGQYRLETLLMGLLRRLAARTGHTNLCLAGGVALNCAANGRILDETPFEQLFVQPAAQDAGTAWGAALVVHCERLGRARPRPVESVAFGPHYDELAIERAIRDSGLQAERLDDPAATGARLLAEGQVIGWFQGRAELGPRALGQRSILADPRAPDMVDRVNHQVKRREAFRPFAPAVLEPMASEWFEGAPTPFMTVVCPVKADKRSLVPAITHVDGTARVQTVSRAGNPRFYELIEAFDARTGVPMVLNTSFNVRGEPIVCRPEEAIADLCDTAMDALILEDRLLRRPGWDAAAHRDAASKEGS